MLLPKSAENFASSDVCFFKPHRIYCEAFSKEVFMTKVLRIVGLLILVAGIAALCIGLSSSQSVVEKGMEKITGRFTEGTLSYIVGGILAIIAGGALALNARRICK